MLSIDHIISINHIIKIPWLFPSLFEFLSDFSNDNFLILDNKIKLTEPMFYIDKLCSEAAAADLSWLSPTPSAILCTARREKEEPRLPCHALFPRTPSGILAEKKGKSANPYTL